jgi:hypothetical protein
VRIYSKSTVRALLCSAADKLSRAPTNSAEPRNAGNCSSVHFRHVTESVGFARIVHLSDQFDDGLLRALEGFKIIIPTRLIRPLKRALHASVS